VLGFEINAVVIILFMAHVSSSKVVAKTKSYVQDPKPGELALGRVNSDENRREARTDTPCNTFG
jgi:hypothetical protein